tara:strand:- start:548 stop:1111 length:564 start_codon:yes stop_codon:yes gene_type:complete
MIAKGFIRASAFMIVVGLILTLDTLTGDFFSNRLGIIPRNLSGIDGILFSPLMHADFGHYISNLLPMIVLLGLLFANQNYKPWRALILIWFLSGVGTWIIGRIDSNHIGASGVIFGLVTFLSAASFFLRSWTSAIISGAVLFLYQGILFGALPPIINSEMAENISWEAHLSGAIGGIIAAFGIRKNK